MKFDQNKQKPIGWQFSEKVRYAAPVRNRAPLALTDPEAET